ncbi:hypothetical protein MML48_1g21465 [Holotrichia oblita]|uniref:Uncharacterized protein n=1 Tax=Holotrichia oblita TaxID=644536 RepID=A0ACB9TWE9_HOLOL|nr:hypothetical protein MML48_1g21465 [Holotrichia oblita]
MESDGSTTDEGKRKRGQGDVAEIFKESKKLTRTQEKEISSDESKLDKLMEMMRGLVTQVQHIEGKQDRYMEEMKEIKLENEKMKKENEELKKELRSVKERLDRLEGVNRRKNAIMQGLKIDARDQDHLKVMLESTIEKSLGIQIKTKAVKKLGPKTYLIELTSIEDKIKIMKNKSKLKEYTEEKVYINDDMTKEEREIQEKIRRKAKEERMKGKPVKIGFQKLVVEGEQWRWSREKEKWNREGRELERKRETPGKMPKN